MRDAGRNENRDRFGKGFRCLCAACTALALTGCAAPFWGHRGALPTPVPDRVDTGFVVTGPDSYDSADTAVLVGRNAEENTVTFLNLDVGKEYTLSMDGATRLSDRYGEGLSIKQFEPGDIVDVKFLKSKKHLTSMQLSPGAWSYADVERYEMDVSKGEVSVGSEIYKLTSNTQYLSEGRKIELMDLNASDVLSFQGIGNQIFAVRVERGHGYLRLVNDEHFIGGWIEIGQNLIRQITEDMLILVPEGAYEVNVTNKGGGGIKSVVIVRNAETELDVGDLEVPEPQSGRVLFSLQPAATELYIDGSKVDASQPVTLEYGLHQLIARASGYQSITRYIRVAQESAGFDVVLEAVRDREEVSPPSTGSGNSSSPPSTGSGNSSSTPVPSTPVDTTTGYYRVYVDAPENVEVYLDGNYVGMSPCSFRKAEGTHVITLRRTNFETRSYTVEIDNTEKDLSYSFADLVENTLTNP